MEEKNRGPQGGVHPEGVQEGVQKGVPKGVQVGSKRGSRLRGPRFVPTPAHHFNPFKMSDPNSSAAFNTYNKLCNEFRCVCELKFIRQWIKYTTITPVARFSKVPKSFRTRRAVAKSQTLRLQNCFIHIFLI